MKPDVRPFSSYITEFATGVGTPQPDMGFVSASNELFDASKIETYYHKEGALSSYVNEDVTNGAERCSRADGPERSARRTSTRRSRPAARTTRCSSSRVNLQDIYGASKGLSWKPRVDGSLYVPDMSVSS